MAISGIGGAAPNIFTALQQTSTAAPAAAKDPDHDGDVDGGARGLDKDRILDVKA